MTDSIMLNGKKYSRKKEMKDKGYEYSIGTQDVKIAGTPMINVREVMYDPKAHTLLFSSSLISKKPLQFIKNKSELINKGDINITLSILDNFGSFCHLNATCFMGACSDNLLIQFINFSSNLRCRTCCYFFNGGNTMLFISWINAFRRVATIEVFVEC